MKITSSGLRRAGRWTMYILLMLLLAAGFLQVMAWVPPHAGS